MIGPFYNEKSTRESYVLFGFQYGIVYIKHKRFLTKHMEMAGNAFGFLFLVLSPVIMLAADSAN